ncbi:hypothetical protein BJ322DRAFT_419660 [Thelephora terrestris]|uniref:Uncharacterized protein n=1 Tax=Thelephora terrestris TaxID=56493 RepID=A0A9P6HNB3_9AGAM|nr:hypothetical protein BJ322DRAFT_419660 [Thelephora terrestris]
MTVASDSQTIFDYLQSLQSDSTRQLDLENSDVPFKVYVFKQKRGDLVVLPPRSYFQRSFKGTTASLYWSTLTIEGLRYAVFYDLYKRQRLCLPAKHPIRQLAYDILCSRFVKLEGSDKALSRSAAVEMRQLLEVVDEILRAEAYTNDEEIPNFRTTVAPLSCAFCGGEVFQKVFSCRKRCLREGSIDSISICPSCYVDGRTCLCGDMTPFRLQPMAPMVASRNRIAIWLRTHSKAALLSDDSGDDETTENLHDVEELPSSGIEDAIFLAALLLCLARDDKKSSITRTCTIRKGQRSHTTQGYALLNCKNCHASRCYEHILSTLNIHSAQAILVYYTAQSPSEAWHKHHVDLRQDYLKSYSTLLSNMLSGSYHPLNHRLAYFAHHFSATDPVSKNTLRGFYDGDMIAVSKFSPSYLTHYIVSGW